MLLWHPGPPAARAATCPEPGAPGGRGYRKATRTVGGKRCTYAIPTVKGRKVKPVYVGRVKKMLHISDKEWDSA